MYPFLFHFGHVYLPSFGALAALGLMAGLGLSLRTARLAGVDADRLWDAGLFLVVAAFVLSRLLLMVEHFGSFRAFPVLLLAVPSLTPMGLGLTAVAAVGWMRWKRLPVLRALDAWAPCGAMVWGFLALGHFAEGSDPGMPTALPWGVPMPGETVALHPVGVYAVVVAAGLGWGLYRRLRRPRGAGEVAGTGLVGVGLAQFLLCFVRQPEEEMVAGLDALQWVALGMIVAGGCAVAWAERVDIESRNRHQGDKV